MELKEIQTLIKFVSSSKVDEVSIEKKDFKLKIKKNSPEQAKRIEVAPQPQQIVAEAPAATASAPAPTSQTSAEAPKADTNNAAELKSPMIGTFYRRASPDKPAFVEVGDTIEKGQVICIIEAMKLFNEIEAEVSGKVVKVLVDDSQPVEYEQPLFLVEPS